MAQPQSELAAALLAELQNYDGKSAALVGEIAHRWRHEPDYAGALLGLFESANPIVQDGATWLLKDYLEKGGELGSVSSVLLPQRIQNLQNWASKLHVCQSLRHLDLETREADSLARWVQPLLNHKRPFVRAWALDALVYLASIDPSWRSEAENALKRASEDPAVSVKARARNLKPG